MPSTSSPCLSTSHTRRVASLGSSPSRTIASRSWSAMPTPAVPAPKTTTRWSRKDSPVIFKADTAAARVIAPVPCMSSLNIR